MAALCMFEYVWFLVKEVWLPESDRESKTSPWDGSLSKGFIETRPKMSLFKIILRGAAPYDGHIKPCSHRSVNKNVTSDISFLEVWYPMVGTSGLYPYLRIPMGQFSVTSDISFYGCVAPMVGNWAHPACTHCWGFPWTSKIKWLFLENLSTLPLIFLLSFSG